VLQRLSIPAPRRLGRPTAALVAWSVLLAAAPVRAQDGEDLPPSLIAIVGRELPRLLGSNPATLRAFVANSGTRVPVASQVDERWGSSGDLHYAYETGPEPVADPDPTFDADDLLLLPADAAAEERLTDTDGLVEVEVRSRTHSGWLYVQRDASGAPPRSPLTYDPSDDAVCGDRYLLARHAPHHALFDDLRLGDLSTAENLLDRTKARVDLELAFGLGTVRRTEDDTLARTTGLHVGPLRIVREVEVRGRLVFGLYTRPHRDRFVYYRDGFSIPTTVWTTERATSLLKSITLHLTMDLNEHARGLTFSSAPEIPTAIEIDGRGGPHGGSEPLQWYLLRNREVGLLGWLSADPGVVENVKLYYNDDMSQPDPPESVPGQFGHHGFIYRASGSIPRGALRLTTHAWVISGRNLDDPTSARGRFEERPTVVVTVR